MELQQRREAAAWLDEGGSADEFREMQARLDEVLAARASTVEVDSIFGDKESSYDCLLALLRHR
jgi:hypothetical protein